MSAPAPHPKATGVDRQGAVGPVAVRRRPGLPVLVDAEAVAASLGTTTRHVRRLVTERRIPFVRVGHFIRFDTAELTVWIDQHRVGVFQAVPSRHTPRP